MVVHYFGMHWLANSLLANSLLLSRRARRVLVQRNALCLMEPADAPTTALARLFSRLFADVPEHLTFDDVEAAFLAAPEFLMLAGATKTGETFVAASARTTNTTSGRAAWRRFKRAEFYLSHAARSIGKEVLLVADMSDMPAASPNRSALQAVPRFTASRAPCVLALPVPVPLKGFGVTDLELFINRSRLPPLPPWPARRRAAVWRGSCRWFPPGRTCLSTGRTWDSQ
jgi:hypothetical protein